MTNCLLMQVASATATKFGLSRGLLGLQYDQINASESESAFPFENSYYFSSGRLDVVRSTGNLSSNNKSIYIAPLYCPCSKVLFQAKQKHQSKN